MIKMHNLSIILNLIFVLLKCCLAAYLEISNDGPGVLDIPLTFSVQLKGSAAMDPTRFIYVFQDKNLYPPHHKEISSGRNVSYTVTYNSSQYSANKYQMNVQVYAVIWQIKAWIVAEANNEFVLKNDLNCYINISQNGTDEDILNKSFVSTNQTVDSTAIIYDPSNFFKNATIKYFWFIDDKQFQPSVSAQLGYNFSTPMNYNLSVIIQTNITQGSSTLFKIGRTSRLIQARKSIDQVIVTGNTWLKYGAMLELDVNCTGSKPFWHNWDIYKNKSLNELLYNSTIKESDDILDGCHFRIMHYFTYNGTYYMKIHIYNNVSHAHKTIQINVFKITSQPQLFFVIVPVISSILVIIIVVVGIAFHLQQRRHYAVEVADFDFQHTEDLNEKTFFERVKESFSKARGTILHPCASGINYDEFFNDEDASRRSIVTNKPEYYTANNSNNSNNSIQ